jgi:branched-chain amino acid aminotransferase
MPGKQRYAWMDGRLVNFENANVHFVNAGLHYGISVFEGIRCYATERGPAIFRLQEHAERLLDSAQVIGFRDLPCSLER